MNSKSTNNIPSKRGRNEYLTEQELTDLRADIKVSMSMVDLCAKYRLSSRTVSHYKKKWFPNAVRTNFHDA